MTTDTPDIAGGHMPTIIPERLARITRCGCGCGKPAPVAQRTNARRGERRGEPLRFLSGHNKRGTANLDRYEERDCGFDTLCWNWAGPVNRKGYGYCQVGGTRKNAHRAVYEALHGELPRRLHLDHLCRNKLCINPAHMEPVTPAENNRRKSLAIRMIEARDTDRDTDEVAA